MKIFVIRGILPMLLCAALLLSGCKATPQTEIATFSETASDTNTKSEIIITEGTMDAAEAESTAPTVKLASGIDVNNLFSDRDLDSSYDKAAAVTVQLRGNTAACDSDAVSIDGGRITILNEGIYLFTGTLTDGQVIVDTDSADKVQIVLNGAQITSATSAAIYSLEADKVFLTLEDGTENALSNGGSFIAIDDNNIDSVVFSKTDLTLNGGGSLTVTSPAGHGVVSKDELTITGGSYQVNAANHGFTGKDSVAIAGGSFTIESGKDGIHGENADDAALGLVYIADGRFAIDAQGDAISATGALQIDNGSYTLTAGGGSSNVTMQGSDRLQSFGKQNSAGTPVTTESCKGLKSGSTLTINGGTFMLDTADDAVHSSGDLAITGGEWTIRTGDDGIHSDTSVVIQAGTFSIPYCYEGIEGQSVTVEGGTLDIISKDDGINAAGGADSSGTYYGFGRQDQFAANENCFIIINGGFITIVSDGDSIDSNGSLTINGGTVNLTCNGNGNTAIDTNGSYVHNGGSVTTNDGSESGTGGPGSSRGSTGIDAIPGGGKQAKDGTLPGKGHRTN